MCEAKMPAYALPCPMAGQVFSWDRWGVKTPGAVERRWRATHRKDTLVEHGRTKLTGFAGTHSEFHLD